MPATTGLDLQDKYAWLGDGCGESYRRDLAVRVREESCIFSYTFTEATGELFAEGHGASLSAHVSMPRPAVCFEVIRHGC